MHGGKQGLHVAVNGWFVGQATAGSAHYIHHLLTHLPELPSALHISLLIPPEAAPFAGEYAGAYANEPAGVVPLVLKPPPLPNALRKLWWEQITVPLAAKRLDADLLWVPYWAAPAWQPCPVVVTVHDLIPALLPAYRGALQHRLYTALVSWTARRAASIITVSHASASAIAEHLGIAADRIHVIYHGPNQESVPQPTAAQVAEVRARYHLPERYFLYLGGFDMRKNVEATLAGYARYLELGGDRTIKLVLAGQLPLHDSAFAPDPRRQVAAHGVGDAVCFCGRVEEVDKAAIYALAAAFVFPSLYEGFGMMILEAMAAGTPVITSGE